MPLAKHNPRSNDQDAGHDELRVQFMSDPRLLASVRGLVRCYAQERGLTEERVEEVVLGLDEACSNAIRHAYRGQTDGVLELVIRSDKNQIEFCLTDHGETAVAQRVAPRPIEAPDPNTLTPGGLGVQLIHRVFDEVAFARVRPHGNIVTMRITIRKTSSE